jgi:zinc finger CCCH domain-containing protein 13
LETSNQYPIITELTNYHSKACKKEYSTKVSENGNSRLRSRSPRSAIEKSHLMVNNPILDECNNNGDDEDDEDGDDGDGDGGGDDDDDDSNAMTVSRIKRVPQRSVSGEKERGMGEKFRDESRERSREGVRDGSREGSRKKGRERDHRREQNTMKKDYTKDFNDYDVIDRSKVRNKERIKIISLDKLKMMNKDTLGVSIGKYNEKRKDDRNSEMGDELAELYDREKDRNNDYERGSDNQHGNGHKNENGRDYKNGHGNGNGNGHVGEYNQDIKRGKEKEREQLEREREREDDDDEDDNDDSDDDSEDEREERRERRRQEENKEDKVFKKGRNKVTTLDMERVRNSNSNSFYENRSIKSKEKIKERFLELEKNLGELRELRDSSRSPRYNDSKSRPHLIGVRR